MNNKLKIFFKYCIFTLILLACGYLLGQLRWEIYRGNGEVITRLIKIIDISSFLAYILSFITLVLAFYKPIEIQTKPSLSVDENIQNSKLVKNVRIQIGILCVGLGLSSIFIPTIYYSALSSLVKPLGPALGVIFLVISTPYFLLPLGAFFLIIGMLKKKPQIYS